MTLKQSSPIHSPGLLPCLAIIVCLFSGFYLLSKTFAGEKIPDSKAANALKPFPQNGHFSFHGVLPGCRSPDQLNQAVGDYYRYWKGKYLVPSVTVKGDYKIKYDSHNRTVSEAMGYGMIITAYMAGADPEAKKLFDGLDRFRRRFPSDINPSLMCWRVSTEEIAHRDDCATDGDMDMAFALLLAHDQWGDPSYLAEATGLIREIERSLVRPDYSIRLGDWNDEPGQIRLSDFMPTHLRAFYEASGDELWTKVEAKGYSIIRDLQSNSAKSTGLFPDFAVLDGEGWKPVKAKFLESSYDGSFSYNSCRVPWRIGWAASYLQDPRASEILTPFMKWITSLHQYPREFKDGYHLNGKSLPNTEGENSCFISPTGVAAMSGTNRPWLDSTFQFAAQSRGNYYNESINMLCLLVMTGNAWLPTLHAGRSPDS